MNGRTSNVRVVGTRVGAGSPYPVREYVYGGDEPYKRRSNAGRRRSAAECGTPAGYKRHYKDGTDPCQPCRDAAAADRASKAADMEPNR